MKEKVFFRSDVMRETENGPVVVANRCKKCGDVYFPQEEACRRGCDAGMEEVQMPQYGTMYTYTVLYRPVNLYPAPHALAQVDFENGLRIEGPLRIEDPEKLVRGHEFKIGSKCEVQIDTLWEDDQNEYVGFWYKVVEEPQEGGPAV